MKFLIIIMALHLTGCVKLASNYIPNDIIKTPAATNELNFTENGQIDLEKLYTSPIYIEKDKDKINAFIVTAIAMSDKKCNIHKALIISNANAWNIGSGAAAILFSGAASIVSNAQRAAQLAASASAASGVQSLVSKEVYANALGTTILRAIDVGREKQKAVLENGMNNDNYDLNIALIDLMAYHDSCSMMAGLIEVTKSLDNRKPSKGELDRDIEYIKKQIASITEIRPTGTTSTTNGQVQETELMKTLKKKVLERVNFGTD